MNFIVDKAFDGLFIFIGVFFAFFFDQYQEDQISKNEVKFNLTQIMRDLPIEKAPEEVESFEYKQTRQKDGTCSRSVYVNIRPKGYGEKYLNIIQQQGLSRFIKDDSLIPILSYYYRELLPKANNASNDMNEQGQRTIERINDKNPYRCLTEKERELFEVKMSHHYTRMKVTEGYSQNVGFKIYSLLKKAGYNAPKKKNFDLSYNVTFKDKDEDEDETKPEKKAQ